MKKEPTPRQITPIETWDQLAVSQIKHQLAPNGFKKIHNGKREVATSQFLSRQTVNTTCVVSANLIRLYRENLRERLDALTAERDKWRIEAEAKLKACRFWEFEKKRQLKNDVMSYAGAAGMTRMILNEIDNLKPSAPNGGKRKSNYQKDLVTASLGLP